MVRDLVVKQVSNVGIKFYFNVWTSNCTGRSSRRASWAAYLAQDAGFKRYHWDNDSLFMFRFLSIFACFLHLMFIAINYCQKLHNISSWVPRSHLCKVCFISYFWSTSVGTSRNQRMESGTGPWPLNDVYMDFFTIKSSHQCNLTGVLFTRRALMAGAWIQQSFPMTVMNWWAREAPYILALLKLG